MGVVAIQDKPVSMPRAIRDMHLLALAEREEFEDLHGAWLICHDFLPRKAKRLTGGRLQRFCPPSCKVLPERFDLAIEERIMENTVVVLVGPQGPRNIGSICRVMGNFGCRSLRLVHPEADHLCSEARHMAVKAGAILEGAAIYDSLADALADCPYSFGTTRRFGKYREDFYLPAEMARRTALNHAMKTALVFGREDSGLSTAELSLCRYFLSIPTDPRLASMNLAQAVAVCLYEIYKQCGEKRKIAVGERKEPATSGQQEEMLQHMKRAMLSIGYLNEQNPEHIFMTYRRILNRAELTEREVRILHGLWAKVEWAAGFTPDGETDI